MQSFFVRPFPTWLSQNEIQTRIRQQFPSAVLRCFPAKNHRTLHRGIGQLTIKKSELSQAQHQQVASSRGLQIYINTKYPINLHPFNERNPRHPDINEVPKVSRQFNTPARMQTSPTKPTTTCAASTPVQIQRLSSQINMLHQMIKSLALKINTPTEHSNQTQQSRDQPIRICEEELQTKAAQLQKREERLQSKTVQLQKREEELQTRAAQLQKREEELQSKTAQLQLREEELRQKDVHHQTMLQTYIQTCEEEFQAKAAQLQTRETELQSKSTQLETSQKELQVKTAQLQAHEKQIQTKSAQIQTRENQLQAREDELKSESAQLQARKTHIESMSTQLQTHQNEHVRFHRELEARALQLQNYEKQLQIHYNGLPINDDKKNRQLIEEIG